MGCVWVRQVWVIVAGGQCSVVSEAQLFDRFWFLGREKPKIDAR